MGWLVAAAGAYLFANLIDSDKTINGVVARALKSFKPIAGLSEWDYHQDLVEHLNDELPRRFKVHNDKNVARIGRPDIRVEDGDGEEVIIELKFKLTRRTDYLRAVEQVDLYSTYCRVFLLLCDTAPGIRKDLVGEFEHDDDVVVLDVEGA